MNTRILSSCQQRQLGARPAFGALAAGKSTEKNYLMLTVLLQQTLTCVLLGVELPELDQKLAVR